MLKCRDTALPKNLGKKGVGHISDVENAVALAHLADLRWSQPRAVKTSTTSGMLLIMNVKVDLKVPFIWQLKKL